MPACCGWWRWRAPTAWAKGEEGQDWISSEEPRYKSTTQAARPTWKRFQRSMKYSVNMSFSVLEMRQ